MDAQQEFQRLKQAFKKREQKRQNIYIANVVDITPRAESGYIVVKLKDGTQVYAHVWMSENIEVGHVVFIVPITNESWNWFVVVGVNATTTPDLVPYVQPKLSAQSLVSHSFSDHEGFLDWSLVNTSSSQVNLSTQVQGVLSTVYQYPQTSLSVFNINTPQINNNQTLTGYSNIGTNVAYAKRIVLNGGTSAKIKIYENNGTVQYETNQVSTPFSDYGGYFFVDFTGSKTIKWEITNYSGQSQSFVLSFYLISFISTVVFAESLYDISATSIIKDPNTEYDLTADTSIVDAREAIAEAVII